MHWVPNAALQLQRDEQWSPRSKFASLAYAELIASQYCASATIAENIQGLLRTKPARIGSPTLDLNEDPAHAELQYKCIVQALQ